MKKIWDQFTDVLGGTLIHPQYFLKKYSNTAIKLALSEAKGTVVDIGCGRMPYKGRFISLPQVENYIGVDHPEVAKLYKGKERPDILTDATKIPLPDGHADMVIMLQVIEHLEDPLAAIKEAARILKPGGVLVLSTVQWYILHDEPFDFFRYTQYGLKSLLGKTNLKVDKLVSEGNAFVLISQTINVYLMLLLKKLSTSLIGKLFVIFLLPFVLIATTISNVKALILGVLDPRSKFGIIVTASGTKGKN